MLGKRCLIVCHPKAFLNLKRKISLSPACLRSYELVVVGGGAGGCSTGAKFSSQLGKGKVAIIEPADIHYYQPLWTLVGGGMKSLPESGRPMEEVLPKRADWIKQSVVSFKPNENKVVVEDGEEIDYEYLVVAMGIQLNYQQIPGLLEALKTPNVGSNYSPLYVEKTHRALMDFKGGNALFTYPNTPTKCPGAPQKIMYIFEDYQRRNGRREKAKIIYNTSLPVLFSSKYYADKLWEVVKERNIDVNLRHNLIGINSESRTAKFENLDDPSDIKTFEYDFLHVTPPMSAPEVLKKSKDLVDGTGFLNVDKHTLQHVKFGNIYGIGDCTNVPIPRTAAAVAGQLGVLRRNLERTMEKKPLDASYNGYTSCPLVTGYSTTILAEFDFSMNPIETFPFDQRKERRSMFHLKKDLLPAIYWQMLKGNWQGPKTVRKIFHLGLAK